MTGEPVLELDSRVNTLVAGGLDPSESPNSQRTGNWMLMVGTDRSKPHFEEKEKLARFENALWRSGRLEWQKSGIVDQVDRCCSIGHRRAQST